MLSINNKVTRSIHIVPAISEEASGPSYSVVRLCKELMGQNQDIALAALDLSPVTCPPVFYKAFPLGFGPRRLGRSPEMYQWLQHQVRHQNIGVLHSHGMWQMNSVYPGWVAKKNQIELIISPRGSFSRWAMQSGSKLKRLFWFLVQKKSLDAATCFHATSESEYEDIRRIGFKQPVAIIPNGIDILPLENSQKFKDRTILFLGRIHPKKGLNVLLYAWKNT